VQEFRVESSGYPPSSAPGTGGQVSVITKSGATLPRSVFEYCAATSSTREPLRSTRNADDSIIAKAGSASTVPKSPLKLNQFGGVDRRPVAQGPRVLLRQLRGLPARCGPNFSRGGSERRRVGDARAVDCGAAFGFLAPMRRSSPDRRTPAFDVAQWQREPARQRDAFSARLDYRINDNWSAYVRVSHDQAESRDPQDVSGRFFRSRSPDERRLQPAGHPEGRDDQRVQGRLQLRREHRESAITQAGSRTCSLNLGGSATINGIAGQGPRPARQPGRPRPREQRWQRPRRPYNPYSLTFADFGQPVAGNHYMKAGADVR
jgi:hypothetical protein